MFFSLKSRLIGLIVVLFVLSFGTLSFLLFSEARTVIRSYIESSALEKMEEYGSYVDMVQMQIYDAASLVFNSDTTKNWDSALNDKSMTEGEKMLANLAMSRFLTQATNSYTSISDISVYREDGLRVGGENQVAFEPAFLQERWYRSFFDLGERWLPAHIDAHERVRDHGNPVISLLMPIGTFHHQAAQTVMKVNVSESYFLEPLNRIHLAKNSTIFLLNEKGGPILSQQAHELGAEAAHEIDRIRSGPMKSGVVYLDNAEGKRDILVYKKLGRTGWMLAGLAPEQELYASLHRLQSTIIAVTAILVLVSLFAAAWLSYGVTKPLTRLVLAMRQVQRGAFDQAETMLPPDKNVKSEVSYVISTFRYMISRLRQHIQNEFELKLLRQQAEYKALLMQINPHFMFNTLELISSLAMQRRTDDTVQVIEDLGKMMRFSMNTSDDRVALAEELGYVRHYISILQTRFGDKLRIDIAEEGRLEALMVIKFILQPLIENAVKYSFRHQPIAIVEIRVTREADRLRLRISDNGPGMPKGILRKLRDQDATPQLDPILDSRSWHIGLGNVIARCHLHYGSLFTVNIHAEEGTGTCIELILPAQEERYVQRIDCG
ncbi:MULTISPECIES: cache domain-containing sensor histidine kinase [Paenibacillus]|uniref:histidine kinase n=2 Tax=Paenibacillus lactis TaxID=228574 RepID=G4HHL9_9BACL|nr:sensor histidine kinase [Paenibacillus lactis]EHB63595.1 integral membrane sensor signal transduction histidine kinase [Paenibacillus lactis 154]MBP1891878.1 two-component system sensor histidine kinase YesM [Paenibacillus lactis]MCM3494340.1 histidine kinase [Paenibacillus lactis]HAF99322.1 sensor histidine kinase [Paenibacillus lactis]